MPTEKPVRVLIIDDSALMRKVLSSILNEHSGIEVVGTARDGTEGIEQAVKLRPDVVTLDVEMPGLSGLDTIPALLAVHEVPIVMVSAYTREGAETTLEALERGAVDYLPKPDRNQFAQMRAGGDQLAYKVLTAAQSHVRRGQAPAVRTRPPALTVPTRTAPPRLASSPTSRLCIAVGISTGGPMTLTRIFTALAPPTPPILIVQHMPAQFTPVLAQRLDRVGKIRVKEAVDADRVVPNQAYIAPGAFHMSLVGRANHARISLSDGPPVSGHKPSVDVLFRSVAQVYQAQAVGIIMTGMGRDGVDGCKQILVAGGQTLGQDEATSVVYGMNKVAFEEKALLAQFSLDELVGLIQKLALD